MKNVLLYVPIVLSLVVIGAHFLRYGGWIGVFAMLALIGLLFLRSPWVARLVQVVLVFGTVEWLRTAYVLAQVRALHGQPFGRMVAILAIVAAVTLCSALVFQTRTLKQVYGLGRTSSKPEITED